MLSIFWISSIDCITSTRGARDNTSDFPRDDSPKIYNFLHWKKIIKRKTEELNSLYTDQLHVSKEIQDFISTEITGSVRELVGAINRIVSFLDVIILVNMHELIFFAISF